jgi:hypothetical protein
MKKSTIIITTVLTLTTILFITAIAIHACLSGKVALGPIPTVQSDQPWGRQIVVDMREWVQNFKPSDARKLNNTGKIVFSWEQLKASYPKQVGIIDDYEEQSRMSFVEVFEKMGKPVPKRLAMHHSPDTVGIERLDNGKYRVVFKSEEGPKEGYIDISELR